MLKLYYCDEEVELIDEPPETLDREHRDARWPPPEGYVWCRWRSNGKHWLHWREQLTEEPMRFDKSGVPGRLRT